MPENQSLVLDSLKLIARTETVSVRAWCAGRMEEGCPSTPGPTLPNRPGIAEGMCYLGALKCSNSDRTQKWVFLKYFSRILNREVTDYTVSYGQCVCASEDTGEFLQPCLPLCGCKSLFCRHVYHVAASVSATPFSLVMLSGHLGKVSHNILIEWIANTFFRDFRISFLQDA